MLLKGHTPGGVTFLSMYQTFMCVTFHFYQAMTETTNQMKLLPTFQPADGCRVFTATDLQLLLWLCLSKCVKSLDGASSSVRALCYYTKLIVRS